MDKPHNRPLLYLDFLGFSEKIMSQTIEQSIAYYKTILGDFEIVTNNSKFKINFDVVSDSAFLWVDGKNLLATTKHLFKIAATLYHNSLLMKRPIRGSIVFDDFIIGDQEFEIRRTKIATHLILGKAIIGGYRWEQAQDWFGISINPLYLKVFDAKLPTLLKELATEKNIILYDIPTKFGEIKSYVISGFLKSHIIGVYVLQENLNKPGKPNHRKVETYSKTLKELKDDVKDFYVLHKLTNTEMLLDYITTKQLFIDNNKRE